MVGPEFHAAGASRDAPVGLWLTAELDVSRAGLCAQTAGDILDFDGAGAGVGLDVPGAGLFGVNVAGPGFDGEALFEAGGVDGPGAGVQAGVDADAVIVMSPEPEPASRNERAGASTS